MKHYPTLAGILNEIEQTIGTAPRDIQRKDIQNWFSATSPYWDWEEDELSLILKNWNEIIRHGKLTWAHIIQANIELFKPGKDNLPAEGLVWLGDRNSFNYKLLENGAKRLYKFKETPPEELNEEELEISRFLNDGYERALGKKIPSTLTGHENLCITTLYVERDHLPEGFLKGQLLPVLTLEKGKETIIVPKWVWPESFTRFWIN